MPGYLIFLAGTRKSGSVSYPGGACKMYGSLPSIFSKKTESESEGLTDGYVGS